MTQLQLADVSLNFGKLAVLKHVSFDVHQGEIFGIAGPNGAGKTTLFNVITGFYHGSGKVTFDGHDLSRAAPYTACRKGVVRTFQTPEPFASMSVIENVRVGAHFGGRNEADAEEALAFVGLTEGLDRSVDGLNLYDKKLTLIAAALAAKPKLLLLDEPVGGLSPKEVTQTMELFRRINKDLGLTLVVIEHVMRVLTSLADRLLILSSGETVCVGEPVAVCGDQRIIDLYLGGGACDA